MNTKLHLSRQSARKQWLQICDERVHRVNRTHMSPIMDNATRSTLSMPTNNAHSNPIKVTSPATLDNCKQCLDTQFASKHVKGTTPSRCWDEHQAAPLAKEMPGNSGCRPRMSRKRYIQPQSTIQIQVLLPATLDDCKQCLDTPFASKRMKGTAPPGRRDEHQAAPLVKEVPGDSSCRQ